jgi:integrase
MRYSFIKMTNEIQVLETKDLTNSPHTVKRDIIKYWDKEYINSKLNMIDNPKHQMFFRFLWYSGVRITEAISMQKKNIDFQNYTMTLKWLKSRKYNYRVAPMHPNLQQLLSVYTGSMLSEEKVFPFSRQRGWQLCKKYFHGHPHQFRHSFAVNWLRNNGDIVILHRILGHSKIQTTMEYLKIVPIDQGKELIKIQF